MHQRLSSPSNPFSDVPIYDSRSEYLFWMYEDPDFQSALQTLKGWYGAAGAAQDERDMRGYEECQAKFDELESKLKADFFITQAELNYIFLGIGEPYDYPVKTINTEYGSNITVTIPYGITKREYINAWEYISRDLYHGFSRSHHRKHPPNRKKAPNDTRLIYAIFKARHSEPQPTYPEIFEMYKAGTLAGYYDTPRDDFDTYKELENMYRRNKP